MLYNIPMKKRAIIIDVDGTAINSPSQKLPSERLVAAVKKIQDDFYFSVATGRPWSFARPVIQALQLHDLCIVSGGTQIRRADTGEVVWQKTLSKKTVEALLAIFRQYPYAIVSNDVPENYADFAVAPNDFQPTEPIYFMAQIFIPDELAAKIVERFQSIPEITCVSTPSERLGLTNLYFVHSEATKEHAVAELLRLQGIESANTIGIGDGGNDIHLFNAVGRKIAMGNAVPALKAQADQVIGSVTADGLAEFLESQVVS